MTGILLTRTAPWRYRALPILLLLGAAAPARAWVGYRAFYGDLSWSPDSRRIAFTVRYDADGYCFPDEQVAVYDISDGSPRLVLSTPALDFVAVNDRLVLTTCGRLLADLSAGRLIGGTVPDVRSTFIPDHEGGGDTTEHTAIQFTDVRWSPDGTRVAGIGYDVVAGTNVLHCWRPGDVHDIRLTAHAAGFCWLDSDSVLCHRTPSPFGTDSAESYVAVTTATGLGRAATRAEYAARQPKPVSARLPAGSWGPQRLGSDSVFFHHEQGFGVMPADGSSFRLIRFPRNGHHSRWESDSVLSFRTGRPGAEPLSFSVGWGSEEWIQLWEEDFYRHDELWQVNIASGELRRVPDVELEPVIRYPDNQTEPVRSPDGRLAAQFEKEGNGVECVIVRLPDEELHRIRLSGLVP